MAFDARSQGNQWQAVNVNDVFTASLSVPECVAASLEVHVCLLPLVSRLTPADLADVPYTPSLLLPVRFDAAVVLDPEYAVACEAGFDGYFEGMWTDDESGNGAFVSRFYTRSEVLQSILRGLTDEASDPSLVWDVGYYLGWLSALALTDRELALVGLQFLGVLVDRLFCTALCA